MSAADARPDRSTQEYGTIVIVGGGCYGGYYLRQLQRAALAGAITAKELVVVDQNEHCPVADVLRQGSSMAIPTRIVVSDWRAFFDDYLGRASAAPDDARGDAIVPSPLMPHLMGEWLVGRARARWSDREIATAPFDRAPSVPWERAGDDGTHYVSFATWMCPINCIEPRVCPHTRGERTWSMPRSLLEYAEDAGSSGGPIAVATLFCRHRAYGVGMFDTAEVLDADRRISEVGDASAAEAIIGTVSHCHGALTRLRIGAPTDRVGSHVG